jgi:tRNA A-37 threonylcarbamoyl transferase component Bud32
MGESAPLALGGVRWWAGPEIDAARLRKLIDAADVALAAGARDHKGSRRKESYLLALEGVAPDYLLKVNHYESLKPWRRLRRSKARAELQRATALAARGIPTPIPVAAGEVRSRGLLDRCYGLVRWLPDATDLLRVWTEERGDAASRRAWIGELGALVRRMHETGVDQEDLAPNNFLWRDGEVPHLLAIDFERTRLRARVAARARVFALTKLDRHFSGASASARMRFLLAYAHGRREEARHWWREIAAFVPQLAQRDAAHWERTGIEVGRRFDGLVLDIGGVAWRGFLRRGAPVEALRAILESGFAAASMLVAESCFVRSVELADERAMAIAWGVAQALHQRRLMPEPLAILRSRDAAVLALARTSDLVPFAEAPASERRAALVIAIDRLLGFGVDTARLRADAFAFSRQRRKALLLDPSACEPGRRSAQDGRATARAVAERLLG